MFPGEGFPRRGGAGFELTSVLVETQMTFLNGATVSGSGKKLGSIKTTSEG